MLEYFQELPISNILGKKVLIIGDVGKGKTLLTAKILEKLVKNNFSKEITVIDMAPKKKGKIGGKIEDYTNLVYKVKNYINIESIRTPRLSGKSKEEILKLAEENYRLIKPYLIRYREKPTHILIINDLSIYLHAGSLEDILECLLIANTFIANSYYGTFLRNDKGSGISKREKELIDKLMKYCDIIIDLNKRKIYVR